MKNNMLIIIPAYNEEETVSGVVTGCMTFGSVAVIDDGSRDETAYRAQLDGATVLTQGCNWGYSSALRAGYAWAIGRGYGHVVQIDADGQHSPRYIPRLSAPVRSGEYDVSIGSRFYHPYPVDFVKSVGVLCGLRIKEGPVMMRPNPRDIKRYDPIGDLSRLRDINRLRA